VRHWSAAQRIVGAYKRSWPGLADEFIQAARIAIWECERRGVTRAGLVKGRVRWAIADVLREHMWFDRRLEHYVVSYDDDPPEELAGVEPVYSDPIAMLWLGVAAEDLTWREYEVIRDHYARDIDLREIAMRHGCSQAAVSQTHKRALAKLRTALEQWQQPSG
jgi:RNA polymerase sigma factor (sigma-70 family)